MALLLVHAFSVWKFNIICVKSEKTAKLENEDVSFVNRQHPQLKLVNKFGNFNSGMTGNVSTRAVHDPITVSPKSTGL